MFSLYFYSSSLFRTVIILESYSYIYNFIFPFFCRFFFILVYSSLLQSTPFKILVSCMRDRREKDFRVENCPT